ncbi:tyrosine-type recombinase/integrase [Megalodesulfovibrio gigas]|uniref:Putative phage integrase family protein n=1 Tax=Megalodesulfovibrio gigas (strain ATCC 19364 / DSM 1382 / NCIMB 9332 / VKM B-1759) TaxID=1121448 RepID=T2GB08_MEGG1|nr:site-specific integrase [Megalodesulfovibrio gigas]AGW13770.1 putative phage integrase family protein [Megalodesulfovibrio gigas DSM 1382 = ATCC 19364]
MPIYQTKKGVWFVQYYLPGQKSPEKEYTGVGEAGRTRAKVRDAEIRLLKAKGALKPQRRGRMHLDELAQLYLDHAKSQGKSERWRKELGQLLNGVVLPRLATRPVDDLAYADVLALVNAAWPGRSPATINRYLSYLQAIFRFGIMQELTGKSPLAHWKKAREDRRPLQLTLEDLARIKEHAPEHLAWALEVMWELGARPGESELLALRWEHVDFVGLTIHVPGTKTEGADRVMPITEDFRARLLVMRQRSRCTHVIEYQGKPVKKFRRSLTSTVERAGIPYPVRMYDIRHLFASVMIKEGADVALVSKLLGHSTVQTTLKHYRHLLHGELAQAIAKKPALPGPKQKAVIHRVK